MPVRTANDKLSQRKADVEVSVDGGTTWVVYNSYMTAITPDTAELETSEFRDLSGTVESLEDEVLPVESITVRMVATDAVDGLYDVLFNAVRSTTKTVDVRWSQGSAVAGDRQFTTVGGKILSCPPAAFDSTTSGVILVEAKIQCSSVTKGVKA